jgi:hypothetical protein
MHIDVSHRGNPVQLKLVFDQPGTVTVEGELDGVFDSLDIEPGSYDMCHLHLLLADGALQGNEAPYNALKSHMAAMERPGNVVPLFAAPTEGVQVDGNARALPRRGGDMVKAALIDVANVAENKKAAE